MTDKEHEEWLRGEEERKLLRTQPHHVTGKQTPFPDEKVKKAKAAEVAEEDAQEDEDDAADDAIDEVIAEEREGEQQAGNAV